ncbi:MAG: tetratricopeptide repeat protein [Anaerolineaceae bacterium]|nr:MAG: tetratricopeptide repeat protein [Anaerolineaceae bacterium]
MVCPNCQSNISDKRIRCDRCGQDLILYKKIFRASNMYYNNGLTRAKVRDLSGAIVALKKSLELNKANTNARNLLGLIYFEMGETVAALSEWVISRYFMPDGNDADKYINDIQDNPTRLDGLNQAIKRYNNALVFAKQGSDDLATIQLKRVIQLNPHFLRAYHLLSLLYMKNGENERAKKCLLRAARIDVSNTSTLRYLKELEPQPIQARDGDTNVGSDKETTSSIMPLTSYREEKPNIMAFVNLVIGVLIGLAVAAFLILPSMKNDDVTKNNQDLVDYSAGMAALEEKEKAIAQLQEEKDALEENLILLRAELDGIVIPESNPKLYDPLFDISSLYMDELAKEEKDREFRQIAENLKALDTSMYESDTSLQLIERIKQEIYPIVSKQYYDTGHDLYSGAKYEEALQDLFLAYNYDPTNVNAIYFIGRTYHRLQDYDSARTYYEIVINEFPDSRRYQNAKNYLDRIQD